MNQKVNFPIFLAAVVILACVLYVMYNSANKPSTKIPGRDQIPPRIPGQDKPLPPPPGMHVPGTMKR